MLAVHVAELRSALQQAYAKAGQPVPVFTDSPIVAGSTVITADHIQQLRDAAVALRSPLSAQNGAQTETQPAATTITLAQTAETLTSAPLVIGATLPTAASTLLGRATAGGARPLSLLIVETGAITYTEKFTVRVFVDKPDADRQTSLRDSPLRRPICMARRREPGERSWTRRHACLLDAASPQRSSFLRPRHAWRGVFRDPRAGWSRSDRPELSHFHRSRPSPEDSLKLDYGRLLIGVFVLRPHETPNTQWIAPHAPVAPVGPVPRAFDLSSSFAGPVGPVGPVGPGAPTGPVAVEPVGPVGPV